MMMVLIIATLTMNSGLHIIRLAEDLNFDQKFVHLACLQDGKQTPLAGQEMPVWTLGTRTFKNIFWTSHDV